MYKIALSNKNSRTYFTK